MIKGKIEHQLLQEFRKLTPEAKGEVLSYTKWMRDLGSKEMLREFRDGKSRGKEDAIHEVQLRRDNEDESEDHSLMH